VFVRHGLKPAIPDAERLLMPGGGMGEQAGTQPTTNDIAFFGFGTALPNDYLETPLDRGLPDLCRT